VKGLTVKKSTYLRSDGLVTDRLFSFRPEVLPVFMIGAQAHVTENGQQRGSAVLRILKSSNFYQRFCRRMSCEGTWPIILPPYLCVERIRWPECPPRGNDSRGAVARSR
jgi:hypothetical protein